VWTGKEKASRRKNSPEPQNTKTNRNKHVPNDRKNSVCMGFPNYAFALLSERFLEAKYSKTNLALAKPSRAYKSSDSPCVSFHLHPRRTNVRSNTNDPSGTTTVLEWCSSRITYNAAYERGVTSCCKFR